MRQNLNTALLLVVIALLLVLVFRPQAGRYQYAKGNVFRFIDTATGTIGLMKFSNEIEKRNKEAAKRREQESERKKTRWLGQNCPTVLYKLSTGDELEAFRASRGTAPASSPFYRLQECKEWWLEKNCGTILSGTVIAFPDGLNKRSCIAWQERQE